MDKKTTAKGLARAFMETAFGRAETSGEPSPLGDQAAHIISGLFPDQTRSKAAPQPDRLWLCLEENARNATARLVTAPTKETALIRFRELDGVMGWGSYDATEVTEVSGYRIVLQPLTARKDAKKKQPGT